MKNNTNIITIEKNVPIPELRIGGNRMKYIFLNNMEIGDSFCINGNSPDYSPKAVRSHIYGKHSTKSKARYTVRTIKGDSENPKEIRVWRIQ
tara:strand:+ start:114 stop:389 length:276 start_codon:yes stop_codon:yes gene_type:complete